MELSERKTVRDALGRIRYPVWLPSRGLTVYAETPIQATLLERCEAIILKANERTPEPGTPPRRASQWDWSRWPWTGP